MKRSLILISSGVIAVFCLIAIHLGWFNRLLAEISTPSIGASSAPVSMNQAVKSLNDALVAASKSVNPTVVYISVVSESNERYDMQGFEDFFRFFSPFGEMPDENERGKKETPDRRQLGGGSGVIITTDGYIVTNCHVVQNATEDGITVTTWDKKEYPAKLIGSDSLSDLAVIKIEEKSLPVAHFGNADDLETGQFVIAVGNPMGLNHTVTHGIISALGREQLGMGNSRSIANYIQTDAAINPGNSGGGLFDLNGSLIGINTLIATSTGSFVGYGFAIPIDIVKSTAQDLIATGKVQRGYIGAMVTNVDDKFAKHLGLSKVEGVIVQGLTKGSPAEKAGVEQGDVILKVNDRNVKTVGDLRSAISRYRAGDMVTLTLWRDKKEITKKVKLEAQSGDDDVEMADNTDVGGDDATVTFDKLGFTVETLSKDLKSKYDLKYGVIVKDVKRFSAAADRGIVKNTIIEKAEREELKSAGQLKKMINGKKSGETILLTIRRHATDNSTFMVVLEIP
ncbi:MAG: Do family serine endopeptidase [Ignavibacteria bacterium]|jgi:serine protease Do|nr:Do family serine endopeptidase [Ignavibacteria bacterium]